MTVLDDPTVIPIQPDLDDPDDDDDPDDLEYVDPDPYPHRSNHVH